MSRSGCYSRGVANPGYSPADRSLSTSRRAPSGSLSPYVTRSSRRPPRASKKRQICGCRLEGYATFVADSGLDRDAQGKADARTRPGSRVGPIAG